MLWPRADTGRGARGQRIQPWCPGSASLPSSGPAKPFLLQGPADPSSSSRVSAYGAETPRLQINLWLQLEQGERGRAWSRGGGRRRGSSRQAEQLSFVPCWAASASSFRSLRERWIGRPNTGAKLGCSSCKYRAVPQVSARNKAQKFPKAHHHLCAGQVKSITG